MEKCSENKDDTTNAILAFDTLYTTNHLKILKLLLPFLNSEHQKMLALFIKWKEFMFTLQFFQKFSTGLYSTDLNSKEKRDIKNLLPLLIPYCNESEKNILSQILQLQNMMHMMDGIQEYLPLIQQFMSSMSEGDSPLESMTGFMDNNPMDMLKNFLSEEQMSMFSSFMENTT